MVASSRLSMWTCVILSLYVMTDFGLSSVKGVEIGSGKGQSSSARGWGWGGNQGQGQGWGGNQGQGQGWGGAGHSQQYHYSSNSHDGGYAGLSFDVNTGISAIGAIIVLLALAAIAYPFLGKSHGSGWDSRADQVDKSNLNLSSTAKNLNLVGTAEKILNAIEKLYSIYSKHK